MGDAVSDREGSLATVEFLRPVRRRRLATADEIAAEAWKVTTTNGGTSITIRHGGGTWPP